MADKFNIAIDCIIFGFDHREEKLKVLLIKRDFEPGKGNWSLMTGFLSSGESFDEAADRILKEQTGLKDIYLEQLHAYSGKKQDPKSPSVAIAYYSLINIVEHSNLSTKHSAQWFTLDEKPDLIFDHDRMIERSIRRLQRRTIAKPIGFKLLPEKFTMRQLITLYQEIWNQKIDQRNFVKKIISLDILEKLSEKDKQSSKKGSFLYKFNKKKYEEKIENGFTLLSSVKIVPLKR